MSELKYFNGDTSRGYVSTGEAARLASCTQTHIGRICRNGEVECVRVGREWFIAEDSLKAYLSVLASRKEARAEELSRERQREYREVLSQKSISTPAPVPVAVSNAQPRISRTTFPKNLALASLLFFILAASVVGVGAIFGGGSFFSSGTNGQSLAAVSASETGNGFVDTLNRVGDFFAQSLFKLFGYKPGEPEPSKQNIVPVSKPAPTPTVDSTPSTPQRTVVVQQTVAPRNVTEQITQYVTLSGVSESLLAERLNQLENKLKSTFYQAVGNPVPYSSPPASGGYSNNIALLNIIDQLDGVTIRNATIIGGSISGTSGIGGSSGLSGSGDDNTLAIWSGGNLVGTTTPTISYLIATSTATSTFAGGIYGTGLQIAGFASTSALRVSNGFFQSSFTNCSTESDTVLYNSTTGKFSCGTDGGGGAGAELNWTFFNNSGIRVSTSSNQVLIGGTSTSTLAQLEVTDGTQSASFVNSGAGRIANFSSGSYDITLGDTDNLILASFDDGTNAVTFGNDTGAVAEFGDGTSTTTLNDGANGRLARFVDPGSDYDIILGDGANSRLAHFVDSSSDYDIILGDGANSRLAHFVDSAHGDEVIFGDGFYAINATGDALITGNVSVSGRGTFVNASTTNISASYASSTRGFFGSLNVGSLTGLLRATAGVVATATIDLVNDVGASILAVANGGTGWANLQANALLLGNGTGRVATTSAGTNGQVLALVDGVPVWTATSTLATITGTLNLATQVTGDLPFANLTQIAGNSILGNISGSTGDVGAIATSSLYTGTNGQILARVSGTWVGVATTTAGTGLTYDGTSFNANCVAITGSADLCDGSDATGGGGSSIGESFALVNGALAPTTTVGIIVSASSTFAGDVSITGNSTTTNATTTNLKVSNELTIGSLTGFLKATAGKIATATIDLVNDVGTSILAVANGGTGWANLQANALLLGNGTGRVATTSAGTNGQVLALVGGVPTWTATSTLATISGTLAVNQGGTGATSFVDNRLLTGNGTSAINDEANLTFDGSTLTATGRIIINGTPAYDLASNALATQLLIPLDSSEQTVAASKTFSGIRFSKSDGSNLTFIPGLSAVAAGIYSSVTASSTSNASSDVYGAVLHATNAGPGTTRGIHAGGYGSTGSTGAISAVAGQIEPVSTNSSAFAFLASLTSSGVDDLAVGYDIESSGDRYGIGFGNTVNPLPVSSAYYRAWLSDTSSANARAFQVLNNAGSEIAYWKKDGTIYTSTNVGIGTSTPYRVLSVAGNAVFASANQQIEIIGATISNGAWALQNVDSDERFRIYDSQNGVERLTISASGNIGIGTSTPGTILSLGDTGANTINLSATATSTFGSGLNIRTGCFAINGTCVGGGSGSGTVGSGTTGQFPYYAADGTSLTATSTLFVETNSRVGINTQTASTSLHVTSRPGAFSALALTPFDSTGSNNIQWRKDTAGSFAVAIGMSIPGSAIENDMVFSTNSGGWTERMRILNVSGNVGIGTSTPQWLLNPTSASAPQLALSAGAGLAQWAFRNAGGDLFIATTTVAGNATTTYTALTISGLTNYIGIGTTSPRRPLQIENGNPLIVFYDTDAAMSETRPAWFTGATAGNFQIGTTSNFSTYTPNLHINGSNGNVGIGTVSPTLGKLQVEGADNSTMFALTATGGNARLYFGTDASANALIRSQNSVDLRLGVGADHLTVKSTGNVGVGTTSPGFLLSLSGGKVGFKSTASTTAAFAVENNYGKNVFQVDTFDNATSIFSVSTSTGATYLTVGAAGNVGVGSTTPFKVFSVAGTGAWSGLTAAASGNVTLCINAGSKIIYEGSSATTCTPSSAQFKNTIQTSTVGLETLSKLRPVTFYFNDLGDPTEQLGFIAEEAFAVDARLVNLDSEGKPYSLKLDNFISLSVSSIQELNLNINTIASTTASTTPASLSFATSFFNNLYQKMIVWLGDATNGIGKLFADEVHVKQICVEKADGTEFCADGDQLAALVASGSQNSPSPESESQPDTESPVLTILGNNPATVTVGDTYADLGVTVTDNVDQNLGIHIYMNGEEVQTVSIDTSAPGTFEITYQATDTAGNIGGAMRTVVVSEVNEPAP